MPCSCSSLPGQGRTLRRPFNALLTYFLTALLMVSCATTTSQSLPTVTGGAETKVELGGVSPTQPVDGSEFAAKVSATATAVGATPTSTSTAVSTPTAAVNRTATARARLSEEVLAFAQSASDSLAEYPFIMTALLEYVVAVESQPTSLQPAERTKAFMDDMVKLAEPMKYLRSEKRVPAGCERLDQSLRQLGDATLVMLTGMMGLSATQYLNQADPKMTRDSLGSLREPVESVLRLFKEANAELDAVVRSYDLALMPPKPHPATPSPITVHATATPVPREVQWNVEELDVFANGNLRIARGVLAGFQEASLKESAEAAEPSLVMKAPWKYYGKVLSFVGVVAIVQEYPGASVLHGLLGLTSGQEVGEIVLTTADGTIVDYVHIGSTGDIRVGDTLAVYGLPVGHFNVVNRLGGLTQQLAVVGKLAEAPSPVSEQSNSETKPTEWHKVARFEGNGIKNTESFSVTSGEWRIRWDTKPGQFGAMNFQIFVYDAKSNTPVAVAANVIGASQDSSVMRGRGEYYLIINTAQPYTVVIEAR